MKLSEKLSLFTTIRRKFQQTYFFSKIPHWTSKEVYKNFC